MIIVFIVLGIGALVGGYHFLKRYNQMDMALFGSTSENYQPFGLYTVILCALAGVVVGIGGMFAVMNCSGDFPDFLTAGALIASVCLSYCVYNAVLRMETKRDIYRKIGFQWGACGISIVVGALGSVVVACVLVIVIFLYIVTGIFKEGSKGKVWQLEDGTKVKESSGIMGEKYYRGNDGRSFDKTGDREFTER